ncbi:MAG: hypothetical protein ACK5LN_03585 [Propioniciclava sp.]
MNHDGAGAFGPTTPATFRPPSRSLTQLLLGSRFGPFKLIETERPQIAVHGRIYPAINARFTLETGPEPAHSLRAGLVAHRDRAAAHQSPQGWITLWIHDHPVEQHRFDLAKDAADARNFVAAVHTAATAP